MNICPYHVHCQLVRTFRVKPDSSFVFLVGHLNEVGVSLFRGPQAFTLGPTHFGKQLKSNVVFFLEPSGLANFLSDQDLLLSSGFGQHFWFKPPKLNLKISIVLTNTSVRAKYLQNAEAVFEKVLENGSSTCFLTSS